MSFQQFIGTARVRKDSIPHTDAASARRKMIERNREAGLKPLEPAHHDDRDDSRHVYREG